MTSFKIYRGDSQSYIDSRSMKVMVEETVGNMDENTYFIMPDKNSNRSIVCSVSRKLGVTMACRRINGSPPGEQKMMRVWLVSRTRD